MAKEYQGSATGGAFSPNKTLQTGDNSKENESRFASTLADYGQMQSQNDQTRVDNIDKQTKGLEQLAKFSEKLTAKLVKDQQARNLEEYEAGIADAYMNGIPQEESEAFDKQEAAINAVGEETDALGAEYAEISGSRSQGEQISASSGWRALGRATGQAKQGAAQYPLFIAMNAERLANANTPQEYAAALSELRKEYTGMFSGMNRAMMGKYMFPKMQEFEASQFLSWQEKNNEMIMNDRVTDFGNRFYADVVNGNGGPAFLEFIEQNKHFLKGRGNARKKLFEIIKSGIKNSTITRTQAEALRDYRFTIGGKETTLGEQWSADFDGLDDLIRADAIETFNQDQAEIKIKTGEIIKEIREYQASLGRKMTEDEKQRIMDQWNPNLGPPPAEITNMMTMEDIESEAIIDRVEAKLAAGYDISEADLEGLDYQQRQQYKNAVAGAGLVAKEEAYIESLVTGKTLEFDGNKEKSPRWHLMKANAKVKFNQLYQQNLKSGLDPVKAIDEAKKSLAYLVSNEAISDQVPDTGASKTKKDTLTGMQALEKDPNIFKTTTIPGTEEALKQLSEMVKKNQAGQGDVPKIPQMYHTLASGMKGISGWDLANQQLQLNGLPPLVKPQAEQYIDGLSDATIKEWMTYKPTPARAVRTITATGDAAQFLDFVAGPESSGDYNAFNLGGKTGFDPIGSSFGNDATERWGKQLTQMTVGEVLDHGFSDSSEGRYVHAAGRYQIIPKTLRGLVQNYGIDTNALYDEAMQDQMALYLAYQRLVQKNKITGLRSEWLGLHKHSAAEIEASLGEAFNNPQLLLEGVS